MNLRVALVGPGKAGSTVARAFRENGARFDAVINPHVRPARSLAREIGSPVVGTTIADIPPSINLIILACPDGALASVARALARRPLPWKSITVAHLSGVIGRAVLDPLTRAGARTLALHPAFPFTSRNVPGVRLHGIGWGVECDPDDWAFARTIVHLVRGSAVLIPANRRAAYHAACAIIANYTVTLAATAETILCNAGVTTRDARRVLRPLLAATASNLCE